MINLEKFEERKGQVKIVLEKFEIGSQKAQVIFILDNSSSTSGLYSKGKMQDAFERLLPIANLMDNDGKVQVYSFNEKCHYVGEVGIGEADGYINKHITPIGGTKYEPVINAVLKIENKHLPTLAIILTDGDCWDCSETEDKLIKSSNKNVFYQFIGVGYEKFSFLEKIDNLSGRVVDNTGFFKAEELEELDDQELYNLAFKDFAKWLNTYTNRNADISKDASQKKKGLLGRIFNK